MNPHRLVGPGGLHLSPHPEQVLHLVPTCILLRIFLYHSTQTQPRSQTIPARDFLKSAWHFRLGKKKTLW